MSVLHHPTLQTFRLTQVFQGLQVEPLCVFQVVHQPARGGHHYVRLLRQHYCLTMIVFKLTAK
jgi:hypothetical protein